MQDIAIVGYAQSPSWREAELTEVQFLFPVIADAISMAGIDRIARHYTGAPYRNRERGRVNAWIEIDRWHGWGDAAVTHG